MNIILHIGSDKTGTTAIQSTLDAHRETLSTSGIIYPKFNISAHHECLALEIQDGTPGPAWKKFNKIIKKNPNAVIISSERFCLLSKEEIRRLKKWLSPHEINVICYVRSAGEYLESGISQQLKSCSSETEFKKLYYTAKWIPGLFNPLVFKAALKGRFILKWKKELSPEKMIVRPFHKNKWHKQDILADFFKALNLSKAYDELNLIASPQKNKTPTLSVMYACHLFNQTPTPFIKFEFLETMTQEFREVKNHSITSQTKQEIAVFISKFVNYRIERYFKLKIDCKKKRKGVYAPSLSIIKSKACQNLVEFILYKKGKSS